MGDNLFPAMGPSVSVSFSLGPPKPLQPARGAGRRDSSGGFSGLLSGLGSLCPRLPAPSTPELSHVVAPGR